MALKVILDTRFYFSHYNPENEKIIAWSKRLIQKISRRELKVASSVITIIEFYGTMGRIVGVEAVDTRIASLKALGIAFIPVTEEIAQVAGKIALSTARIPLADAIIAATALLHAEGVVVTDDEHFKLIKGVKADWSKEI